MNYHLFLNARKKDRLTTCFKNFGTGSFFGGVPESTYGKGRQSNDY